MQRKLGKGIRIPRSFSGINQSEAVFSLSGPVLILYQSVWSSGFWRLGACAIEWAIVDEEELELPFVAVGRHTSRRCH